MHVNIIHDVKYISYRANQTEFNFGCEVAHDVVAMLGKPDEELSILWQADTDCSGFCTECDNFQDGRWRVQFTKEILPMIVALVAIMGTERLEVNCIRS